MQGAEAGGAMEDRRQHRQIEQRQGNQIKVAGLLSWRVLVCSVVGD